MTKSPSDETRGLTAEEQRDQEAEARRKQGIVPRAEGEQPSDETSSDRLQESLAQAHLERNGRPPAGAQATGPELEEELLLEEIATELPLPGRGPDTSDPGPVAPLEPMTPSHAATLEARLQGVADRSDVAQLTLELACGYARVAALFVVNRGLVAGLQGLGEDLGRRVDGIMVPVGAGKLFSHSVSAVEPYRTGVPDDDVDNRLLCALGRIDAQERVVLPIAVRGRVVNLLYADNGPDAIAETSLAALNALCHCVARAYESLILGRKKPAGVSH